MESDPNIIVSVTGPEHHHAIRIQLASHTVYLHTRSAVDLMHKLSLAILDWTTEASLEILKKL